MTPAGFWARNRWLIAVFAALLLVFAAQSLFFSKRGDERNRLYRFSIADVTSITIVNEKMQMTFVRDGQRWTVPSTPGLVLAKSAVDSFLDDLRHLGFRRRLSPGALAAFGLDRTNCCVGLEIGGRKELLVAGSAARSGKSFYASTRMPGDPVLILAEKDRELFQKDLFYFREKRILDLSPARITGVTLAWRGLRVALRKETGLPGVRWTATAPVAHRVATEDVNNLLFDLEGLEAREFVEGIVLNREYYGLPSGVAVTLQSKDGLRQTAEFGARPGEGGFVMKDAAPSPLYRVDYYFLTSLSNYVTLFTDRSSKGEGHDPE